MTYLEYIKDLAAQRQAKFEKGTEFHWLTVSKFHIAFDAKRVQELLGLAEVVLELSKDVEECLTYSNRAVNVTSSPKLPLSLAIHYKHVLEPHLAILKKLKSESL